MPRLSYPGGRKASALVLKKDEDEAVLQGQEGERQLPDPEGEVPDIQGVQEDPTTALKAQIEALRKSEREAILRAEAADRKAAEEAAQRETERHSSKEQIMNSNVEAIGAALAAAQSEADLASEAIESAIAIGDAKGQAEAYRKLSMATARMFQLEQGKEAAERELKVIREAPKPEYRPKDEVAAAVDAMNVPYLAKKWLKDHPEYVVDPRRNTKISALHYDLLEEGLEPYSAQYFDTMEQRLGLREAPQPVVEEEVEEQPRRISSAPPSREAVSSSGQRGTTQITLTVAQKEAARISGISEKDYVLQLLKLRQEKANGNYGGGQ